MKVQEMRSKKDSELQEEIIALRKEQFNLRLQNATGQLGNPSAFKRVRKEIAQLKTVISEQERGSKA
ncbi:MAG TPA: 50S ribosomal protein L29 [Gammaproteobacteria bacterium]|nr:50S ribosomal protein L29 [Gammaproteobacteria bacterium]